MNSGRAGEIRQETVEAIRVRLRKLCEMHAKREVTLQNIIGLLSREIKRLLKRGFTMKEIAEQFNRGGIPLAAGTFRAYKLRHASKRGSAAIGGRQSTHRGAAPAQSERGKKCTQVSREE
jgi:hypothetical protein